MDGNGDAKAVWLDCDPGHDDAIAITLALFAGAQDSFAAGPAALQVLGLSTTHGNASGRHTYVNAIRLLSTLNVEPSQCKVWRGADRPLLRDGKADVGIHGDDGLAGVEALPSMQVSANDDSRAVACLRSHLRMESEKGEVFKVQPADPLSLVQHQLAMLADRRAKGLPPISLIATGPLTNVAMLIRMCPGDEQEDGLSLLRDTVAQIVIMGGAAGSPGNRSPLAEWNILVDPEAASIVFDADIPVVMAGLNVTHQAIFTRSLHAQLLGADQSDNAALQQAHRRASRVRRMISSAMTFFAGTYADQFGFVNGPPLHDMLCVAYVLDPTLFFALSPRNNAPVPTDAQSYTGHSAAERIPSQRFRVQVDTSTGLAAGTTVVDFYGQWPIEHHRWSKGGRNAVVLEFVDTERMWPLFFTAVDRAEAAVMHNI